MDTITINKKKLEEIIDNRIKEYMEDLNEDILCQKLYELNKKNIDGNKYHDWETVKDNI